MRAWIWLGRVTKEILREPLSLVFGIGFPVLLLLLLSAIQSNVPIELFALSELTPGIAVFGLSFLSLFSAQLISKDRAAFVLGRMFTTPMRARDFIVGYTLPLLPMALAQGIVCYAVAWGLGLPLTWNVLMALILLLPVAAIYIAIGLLCGSAMQEKAATAVCGALLTNLSAWLSGTWFSLELVGKGFSTVARCLPFSHAVELGRAALQGRWADIWEHVLWASGYAAVLLTAAIFVFRNRMKT
ncbi:MAG: ABC transporter permease [Clostridia bacterium]|nr:ABC transporter permease [Clostridia bacterium]